MHRSSSETDLPAELAAAAAAARMISVAQSNAANMSMGCGLASAWKQHGEASDAPSKLVEAHHACSSMQFTEATLLAPWHLTRTITSCESEFPYPVSPYIGHHLRMSDTD